MSAQIQLPGLLRIGGGALDALPEVLARIGVARPLLVTDATMVELGTAGRVERLLTDAGIATGRFDGTVQEPTASSIDRGVEALHAGRYDGLVAVGGGSPIDSAKAMAVLGTFGGRMRDYKVPSDVDAATLPVVGVPTTAGTGSEATRFTVITDDENGEKMLCRGQALLPRAAIVDYELTLSAPARLTADTGLDALTHAIEAYVSRLASPFTDGLALAAMGAIARSIERAVQTPEEHAAREAMMVAATQAGMAFSNASVCLVHGMSRPVGAFFHVPHGLSNAMLLPTVTRFSAPAARTRYAVCARQMGWARAADDDETAVDALLGGLERLNRELRVPGPADYGIERDAWFDSLETMAEQAEASGSPANNPRVPSREEMVALYTEAWGNR